MLIIPANQVISRANVVPAVPLRFQYIYVRCHHFQSGADGSEHAEACSELLYLQNMEPMVGIEPTTYSELAPASSELLYLQNMEPMVGIEPTTYGLRNRCSTS